MNIGKACAIFEQIESDKYTNEEKSTAIHRVLKMPTHNGTTKDSMLAVIKYLFDKQPEVEEMTPRPTSTTSHKTNMEA